MNIPPVPISTQSVTETGRSLQAPGAAFFADRRPITASSMRGGVFALASMILTAAFETLRQWGGLPPYIYVIWGPVVTFASFFLAGLRDQQTVV